VEGLTVYNLPEVLEGAVDELLDGLIAADQAERLAELDSTA
jgi:protein subunit release factor A